MQLELRFIHELHLDKHAFLKQWNKNMKSLTENTEKHRNNKEYNLISYNC